MWGTEKPNIYIVSWRIHDMGRKSYAMWAAWSSVGIIGTFSFDNSDGDIILNTS